MQLITMKERRVETITIYRLHDLKESDNKDLFQKTEGVRELRGYRKKEEEHDTKEYSSPYRNINTWNELEEKRKEEKKFKEKLDKY